MSQSHVISCATKGWVLERSFHPGCGATAQGVMLEAAQCSSPSLSTKSSTPFASRCCLPAHSCNVRFGQEDYGRVGSDTRKVGFGHQSVKFRNWETANLESERLGSNTLQLRNSGWETHAGKLTGKKKPETIQLGSEIVCLN